MALATLAAAGAGLAQDAPGGPAAEAATRVTTPAEHLGRPLAADFELADWGEVASYFRRLANESPRVTTSVVGTTTEGRDFLLSVVTSEENHARLDELRGHAAALADPRGRSPQELERAVREGRPILFVSCAMHATETAAPQFAMALAHLLATSDEEPWASARRELVVLIAPSLNPDGQDHVVEWYRENVGTPWEATGLTKLYQLYAGHDNNRDWFMLTQAETRIVTRLLYTVWHPQVYWDVHQQGSSRERLFVPPFRDPLNPNLDAGIIAGIGTLGGRALFDLTREGFTGVSTGVSYDMWWNGGNRNVPVRHNVVGLLTEAASVRIATPVFLPPDELDPPRGLGEYVPSNRFPAPWPGGWWRLRDIVDYELGFARSLLRSLAREPELWLGNALAAAERAIERGRQETPRAWVLPSDQPDIGAVRRLVDVLLQSGVELAVAHAELEADGRRYPAGSLVIPRDQPYGQHVKDLFEVQRYPEGEPPYDVAGWTLPLLLGVRRVEVVRPLEGAPLRPVADVEGAVAGFAGDARAAGPDVVSAADSDGWRALIAHLAGGGSAAFATEGERAGLLALQPADAEGAPEGFAGVRRIPRLPRIGLYAPWRGSMDEGWMRWVLDTWEVPYVRVRNEMLRAGRLGDFLDVLVVPGVSGRSLDRGRAPGSVAPRYAGGLDPEGAVAVEEFVRAGGTLVVADDSCGWAIELLRLPLADVTRDAPGFSCPGSVLRAVPRSSPAAARRWTAGLAESVAVFFSRSHAYRVLDGDEREEAGLDAAAAEGEVETLLAYAPTRVLYSGWIAEPGTIAGHGAWLRARHGAGAAHLFGFRPQYRGWAQASFHLLFRALLFEEALR